MAPRGIVNHELPLSYTAVIGLSLDPSQRLVSGLFFVFFFFLLQAQLIIFNLYFFFVP